MSNWQKPSFEELAMNAEIGGYQPDEWEGDRYEVPFVQRAESGLPETHASSSPWSSVTDVTMPAPTV